MIVIALNLFIWKHGSANAVRTIAAVGTIAFLLLALWSAAAWISIAKKDLRKVKEQAVFFTQRGSSK
jgi:hypothetical protein